MALSSTTQQLNPDPPLKIVAGKHTTKGATAMFTRKGLELHGGAVADD